MLSTPEPPSPENDSRTTDTAGDTPNTIPLLTSGKDFHVSPQRYYCLFVVTFVSALQGGIWANFGPIAEAVKPLYGWDDGQIALLANWGPIMYLVGIAPSLWLIDTHGLKAACVVASALVFVGSVLRCVHVAADGMSAALMHAAQALNGLAGPVAMSAGPVLSAAWFAPWERTRSTAVVGVSNYGGTALVFICGPWLVPARQQQPLEQVASNLRLYMIGEAGFSALLLLAALLMPSRPANAPARSATFARSSLREGLFQILRLPQFWAAALGYGMITGFFGAWGAMLGPNMQAVLTKDEAETQGGWIGFWGALAGMPAGVALSACADRMQGRKKPLLVLSCTIAAAAFLGFALLCTKGLFTLRHSLQLALMFATSIIGSLFANAVVPLYYELAVEAVAAGFLALAAAARRSTIYNRGRRNDATRYCAFRAVLGPLRSGLLSTDGHRWSRVRAHERYYSYISKVSRTHAMACVVRP